MILTNDVMNEAPPEGAAQRRPIPPGRSTTIAFGVIGPPAVQGVTMASALSLQDAFLAHRKQDCNSDHSSAIVGAVTTSNPHAVPASTLAHRLGHVRWLLGGTGSGKSTVTAALVRRFGIDTYSGDRSEHDWLDRCTPQRHPHFAAARNQRPGDNWRNRSAEEAFDAMGGRHGETVEFLINDLLARPADRLVLVDYFGVLPRDLAPLLENPWRAAFLVPTAEFRRTALAHRYADPVRARANWGDLDPDDVLRTRLARDALWDAELSEQATNLGLPLITIDGSRPPEAIVDQLAEQFQLHLPGHD